MTILHVLEPFASGVTTALIAITKELTGFRHIVIHGSRNWVESPESIKNRFRPGVEFVEWKSVGREISFSGDLKALRELIAILKPYKPRQKVTPRGGEKVVVHLHSSKAGFLGRLGCRILGIKSVIYTPHCGAFLRTDISPLKRKFFRFLEWLGGLFGGRVVGCGPSEGELYRSLGKNSTFVSNGVELHSGQVSGAKLPNTGAALVSFTGIASFQKDPALFSAIAADCAEAGSRAFYWIGDGPLEKELDRNFVTLTGWKKTKEVEALLKKTAVYLSCSAWEGLPYGVLEAMNASCALLLRNVPGNRDLVIPGENGWLFDSRQEAAERLSAMLKDKTILASMGKRSREILEQQYSMKQMGEGYRKIYAEAVGEQP